MFALLGPLWWLWIVAPFFVAFAYILASKQDERRMRALSSWRKNFGPDVVVADDAGAKGYREAAKPHVARRPVPPREVAQVAGGLAGALRRVADGEILKQYELVPRLAYLAVGAASATESTDYQAVVAKLDEKGPSIRLRPVPVVEGV